jgi:hypothetical protein
MSDENQPYDEDLAQILSAYLDGQLASAETARIEERLAEDPEARTLLEQLRQVSQMVHSLPHTSAPADLADEVMQQLERDALLGVSDTPEEMAGRTHLRFRRFAAAAAILILAGAVVIIVYSVLFKSPTKPIVDIEPPLAKGIKPPDKPIIDPTQIPDYNQLYIVVNSFAPDIEADRLNVLLEQFETENVVRKVVTSDVTEFAFMCSTDQMQEIFRSFKSSLSINHIDLIVAEADKHDILRQYPDLLAPREPYLPDLRILGPNEVIPSMPPVHIPDTIGADRSPPEKETIDATNKTSTQDGAPPKNVGDRLLSLVGVRITIRLDDFHLPETNPDATDPNSLDTPVNLMLKSESEKLLPEPNVLHRP